ncbi:MAG: hypothetical protein WD027_00665 [Gaiellales bacterium]
MLLKIVGWAWIGVATGALIIAGIAASYFLLIGGIFDLFTDRTLSSGIGWVDEQNRDLIANYGSGVVGAVKIFFGEPLLLGAVSIAIHIANLPGYAFLAAAGFREDRKQAPSYEPL